MLLNNEKLIIADIKYISNKKGEIFRRKPRKKMKLNITSGGYLIFSIPINHKMVTISVHRFVAYQHIENPNNFPVINHINGIKTDNRVNNLEWCTSSYNEKESYKNGKITWNKGTKGVMKPNKTSFKKGQGTKKVSKFDKQGNLIKKYSSVNNAAEDNNLCPSAISDCLNGRNKTSGGFLWKYN